MAKPDLNSEVLVSFMPLGVFLYHLVFMLLQNVSHFYLILILGNVYVLYDLSKIQRILNSKTYLSNSKK